MKSFVSSTYVDLREFRESAIRTLERISAVYAMEKFFASDHRPKDECLAMLRDCSVMILVIGERYGSIDEETGLSITELEFRAAVDAHIPVLAFLKVDAAGKWSPSKEEERPDQLRAFRDLVGDHATWSRVRTPEDLAVEISLSLRSYEQRHGLLGARMSAFQTPEEFFEPFIDPSKIFTHALPVVGRQDYLAQIEAFPQLAHRVMVLPGRGGLGKSRLLREGLRRVERSDGSTQVRMLRDLNQFNKEMANDLPAGPILIAVDDAHNMRDLGTLLAVAREYASRMQVILSTRPQGIPLIRQRLADARFTSEEILELSEIAPLSLTDTRRLIQEILPEELAHLADRLVHVSGDSPLVTVVGAQLLVRHEIDPGQLVHADDAKREIFELFQDVQLGELSDQLDRALARRIVELVAAIGPFRSHHDALVERSATFLGIEPHQVRRNLVVLEDVGALVEVRGAYRVTPDVLSDYILHKLCVMPSGASTGFADHVFLHFEDIGLGDFLANLVDVQPEKALEFIHTFIESHDLDVPDVTLEEALRDYSTNPIRELPSILQTLTADARYVGRALDALWRLGRNAKGPSYQYPDHPMRILEDTAKVRADKDLRIYEEILRAGHRWSNEPDAFSHQFSPLDVLDKLMERESIWIPGEWQRENPLEQGVSAASISDVRRLGIRVLGQLTQSTNPIVQTRALSSLLSALWPPEELRVEGNEGAVRHQENQLISDWIHELLTLSESALLAYTVEGKIQSMRPNCGDERNRALCDLIARAPVDLDSRLMRYLRFGRVQYRFFQDEASQGIDQLHDAVAHDLTEVVQHLVDRNGDASAIKILLERNLNEIERYGEECRPDEILRVLATEHASIATAICELVVADPDSPLALQLDHLLVPLRAIDRASYRRIFETAFGTENPRLQMPISHTLPRVEALEPWERDALRTLAEAQVAEFRPNIIRALARFPRSARDEGLAVIRTIDIESDPDVAESLVEVVVGYPMQLTEPLPEDITEVLLPKLVPVTRVADGGRATHRLLAHLAIQDPEQVVEFFLDRIRLGTGLRSEGNDNYDPVPMIRLATPFDLDRADSEARHRALTRIANAMVWPPDGVDPYDFDDLYALMANGFDNLSIQVLDELVEREGRYGVGPALHLLKQAPNQVVFDRVELVGRLLEVARQAGQEELADVHAMLFHLAWAQPEFVPGVPSLPPTVEARNRGRDAASRQPAGSLIRNFYESLVRESEIKYGFEQRVRDELNS